MAHAILYRSRNAAAWNIITSYGEHAQQSSQERECLAVLYALAARNLRVSGLSLPKEPKSQTSVRALLRPFVPQEVIDENFPEECTLLEDEGKEQDMDEDEGMEGN